MDAGSESLPDDIETLKAALIAARAEVALVHAQRSDDQALIAYLKLQIEKLNRDRYGPCVDGSALARGFFTCAGLVGAAMCSAFECGSHDRWP
jgi:hypothetical protein